MEPLRISDIIIFYYLFLDIIVTYKNNRYTFYIYLGFEFITYNYDLRNKVIFFILLLKCKFMTKDEPVQCVSTVSHEKMHSVHAPHYDFLDIFELCLMF